MTSSPDPRRDESDQDPDEDAVAEAPPRAAPPPAAANSDAAPGGSRLLRVAATLLQVHVQIARQEFARDEGRIMWGVILILIGALLVAAVIVLLQVLGIAVMQAHGLGFAWAVLAMVFVDAGLGALLIFLGKRALKQPLMAETRALVRRTLRALTSP